MLMPVFNAEDRQRLFLENPKLDGLNSTPYSEYDLVIINRNNLTCSGVIVCKDKLSSDNSCNKLHIRLAKCSPITHSNYCTTREKVY
ncbi:hypothetical protein TNIN_282331 [Trichonephila inaurata madagascariensis]|uniref:Uncharacterized protein n=1 Tax=Trichonephila inaurata madagascariensis TaxID=2747483 RepID=A0A8X6YNC2_9ARAC|nr:hypothetical protein TNIN_282331 [Trichonephila inaurata madagascariensis]